MSDTQGCATQPGLIAFSTFVVWLAVSLAVHVTIALIAPGDAGTVEALVNGALLIIVLMVTVPVVLVLFPLAACASWPFRRLAFSYPWFAYTLGAGIGALAGYLASFVYGSRGLVDQAPGSIAGFVAGVIWVLLVRRLGAEIDSHQTEGKETGGLR